MTKGIELIAAERQKQIDKHGFTGEHHAQHPEWYDRYQLLQAAIALLLPEVVPLLGLVIEVPGNWDATWFKNFTERSQDERLKISGALIAAEIDRRQFLNGKKQEYRHFIPVTLTREEFGKVLGQVLDETGMFYKFKEHIEDQGYSLNEFGLTESSATFTTKRRLQMSNEFKGTPGKWEITYSYDEAYSQACINIDSEIGIKSLATVWSALYENSEKTIADATLISKAPEMLEMLNESLSVLKQLRQNIEMNPYYQTQADQALKTESKIENLIKEATCTSK